MEKRISLVMLSLVILSLFSILSFAQVPTVQVTSPTDNQVLSAGDIPVSFIVTNYQNSPTPLHLHFTLDQEAPRTHFNFNPYILTNVGPGTHALIVELADSSYKPLSNPEARQKITFSVGEQNAPSQVEQPQIQQQPVQQQQGEQQPSVPIGQVYSSFSTQAASGKLGGFISGFANTFMGSAWKVLTYLFMLLLAASLIVGGYYGYNKLVQGHYAEVPADIKYNLTVYNYIKQCISRGFQRDAIYAKLKQLGFSEKDLNYHFDKVDNELKTAK